MSLHFTDIFKLRWVLTVFFTVLLLSILAFVLSDSREPSYNGQPLTFWLDKLKWWGTDSQNESAQAIRAMGTNAIPKLVKILNSPSVRLRQKVMFWLNKQRLFLNKFKIPPDRHWQSTIAFKILGTNAQSAVIPLSKILQKSRNPGYVATSLASIGPASLDVLIQAINHPDFNVQAASIAALFSMRQTAFPAIPALLKKMEDGHTSLREMIVDSLAQIDAENPSALPALIKQLQSDDILIKKNAARTLKQYGPRAKAAVPQLLISIKDTDPQFREQAILALCKIDFDIASKEGLHPEMRE